MARRVLAAAGLLAFLLTRLVALPEPLGVDEGIFAATGWGLTQGLVLYRDVWDQKPPGIHLAYAAAFQVFGADARAVVWIDALACAAACAFVFVLGTRLRSRACGWTSAIVFTVGTYPAFALPYGGFLERAVPETFITALVAAAAWAAVSSDEVLMGLAIGLAAVFKPTALIYWPALAGVAAWLRPAHRGRLFAASAAALCLAPAAVALWLWSAGELTDARIAIVDYNRAYVAAGAGWSVLPDRLAHELWRLVKTDPLWCLGAVGAVAALLRLRRTNLEPPTSALRPPPSALLPVLAFAWLAAMTIAVAANGVRMYATYFLPAGPPLALLAGSFLTDFARGRRVIAAAGAVALAAFIAIRSHYPDRLVRYVRADIAQLQQTAPREPYLEMFGGYANGRGYSARANAELAEYLRSHTTPDDRVYIFGMAPAVYFESARLPANRFVWTFPGVAPFAGTPDFSVDALAHSLDLAAPRYLVLERNNRDSSTGWKIEDVYAAAPIRRLLGGYAHEIEIEDFTVLRRR